MSDHGYQTQEGLKRRASVLLMLLLLALNLCLNACGKKPSHVDPPLGVEEDTYPRTYPDIKTDPKPDVDMQSDSAPKLAPQPKHF